MVRSDDPTMSFTTTIEHRKQTIIQFIKHYTQGSNGVVLGVSGGIDSALVLGLAVEALGKDNVHVLHMPYTFLSLEGRQQKSDTRRKAEELVELYGIEKFIDTLDIDEAVDSIDESLQQDWGVELDKVDTGNIMARVRMTCLYAYARPNNLRVIGTSNKTEIMAGYSAKWGDGVADLEPIAHLYKCEVNELAEHIGLPEWVITQAPSAGLWVGQTDEDEMGITYETLDTVFTSMLNPDGSWDTSPVLRRLMYEQFGSEVVDKVFKLWSNSQHKRKPIPSL